MKMLVVCTTDSMIWNFLIPHIDFWKENGCCVDVACSKTGFYFDELAHKYHLNMIEVPFERFPFKKKNILAYRKLNEIVKNNGYDFIISQEPVGGVIGRIVGYRNHCKNIYTAHGFHFYKNAPMINWLLYYPIEWCMSFLTDGLITINEEDYQRAKKFHAKHVYKISGIGVDLNKFHKSFDLTERETVRNEFGIPSDAFVILTVAELIPRKNYETAFLVLSQMKDQNFRYLICGEGEKINDYKNLVKKYGIEDKVIFLGFRKDVYKFYLCSDVFFFPSFQEGLSIALIEAMASGLPVICSKIRGNTDLIEENKGGFLFEPRDVDGFRKGLFVLNKKECPDFGNYNNKFVNNFSIEKSRDQFYKVIKELMGDKV